MVMKNLGAGRNKDIDLLENGLEDMGHREWFEDMGRGKGKLE